MQKAAIRSKAQWMPNLRVTYRIPPRTISGPHDGPDHSIIFFWTPYHVSRTPAALQHPCAFAPSRSWIGTIHQAVSAGHSVKGMVRERHPLHRGPLERHVAQPEFGGPALCSFHHL